MPIATTAKLFVILRVTDPDRASQMRSMLISDLKLASGALRSQP